MKNALIALVVSFSLGFALSTSAATQSVRTAASEAPKCKAAGQPCNTAQDCCSRMCRKDTKKCS